MKITGMSVFLTGSSIFYGQWLMPGFAGGKPEILVERFGKMTEAGIAYRKGSFRDVHAPFTEQEPGGFQPTIAQIIKGRDPMNDLKTPMQFGAAHTDTAGKVGKAWRILKITGQQLCGVTDAVDIIG